MSPGGLWGAVRGWIAGVTGAVRRWVAGYVIELHVYPGLALVGYGVYIWRDWLGLVVWGLLLMVVGVVFVRAG